MDAVVCCSFLTYTCIMDAPSWLVLKFGGTSVATPERWRTIATVAQRYVADGYRPVLVCSALSGISDQLENLVQEAAAGASPDATLAAVRAQHAALADGVGVSPDGLDALWATLEARVETIAAQGAATPADRAAVLGMGELLSTRLGEAILAAHDVPATWIDARQHLRAADAPHLPPARRYGSATCSVYPDPVTQQHLAQTTDAVCITQGFIASNALGETVLLGRGGSDTSAAYFAALLDAERLEIWTDVPGLFTTNPHDVPAARLLKQLSYDEAQELATMGGSILHPRCLAPVRQYDIPLHVRSTNAPAIDGTVISPDVPDTGPQVKALSAKTGITAIRMDTLGMWQEVGFLADVFAVFKHHGLSVDLVATSEANVTVTLDPMANALDPEVIDRLVHDLGAYCTARVVRGCGVVSLVGRHIRALLHELGPALEVFDEQQIYMVSQAASDLNFSFVVDEEQAPRLVHKLHDILFAARTPDATFGPTWSELVADEAPAPAAEAWWHARRDDLLALAADATPTYVYDEATLRARAADLQSLAAVDRVFYAIKANPHPAVLRTLADAGLSFECVSPGEVERVQTALPDHPARGILFQPNFAAPDEYRRAFARGVRVTLDNVQPLAEHPALFAGQEIFARIDPGAGRGHHRHVRTAGAQSKFGMVPDDLSALRRAADAAGTRITGLHVHVGSGITEPSTWAELARFLASLADAFPHVETLNVGGGLGVPRAPGAPGLDLAALDEQLTAFKREHPHLALWMEPGRFLVAEAGVLLARVTQTKTKGPVHYVGLDAGMHTLLRPALYGSYHPIVNLSRLDAPAAHTVQVVGPICESGDVLGRSRRLPDTAPGDVLLISTVGAYGASMSLPYNLRPAAREALLTP